VSTVTILVCSKRKDRSRPSESWSTTARAWRVCVQWWVVVAERCARTQSQLVMMSVLLAAAVSSGAIVENCNVAI
jgi:hypothetical protein